MFSHRRWKDLESECKSRKTLRHVLLYLLWFTLPMYFYCGDAIIHYTVVIYIDLVIRPDIYENFHPKCSIKIYFFVTLSLYLQIWLFSLGILIFVKQDFKNSELIASKKDLLKRRPFNRRPLQIIQGPLKY